MSDSYSPVARLSKAVGGHPKAPVKIGHVGDEHGKKQKGETTQLEVDSLNEVLRFGDDDGDQGRAEPEPAVEIETSSAIALNFDGRQRTSSCSQAFLNIDDMIVSREFAQALRILTRLFGQIFRIGLGGSGIFIMNLRVDLLPMDGDILGRADSQAYLLPTHF